MPLAGTLTMDRREVAAFAEKFGVVAAAAKFGTSPSTAHRCAVAQRAGLLSDKPPRPLSANEEIVLAFLRDVWARLGEGVSFGEVAKGAGLGEAAATWAVKRLVRRGLAERGGSRWRSIRPVGVGDANELRVVAAATVGALEDCGREAERLRLHELTKRLRRLAWRLKQAGAGGPSFGEEYRRQEGFQEAG